VPKIFESAVIDAPMDQVWSVVRDFDGLSSWHPLVAESRIEDGGPSDRVGCVRNMQTHDGDTIRETLLRLDDHAHVCTYDIVESHLGVAGYVATLRLLPITATNATYAEWSAEFRCAPEAEGELVEGIGQGVFQAGFRALQERLGR
jgi:hypothetical protein